ncbi:MAG: hypothetical protein WEA10_01625 [Actinomycetota bacterium]
MADEIVSVYRTGQRIERAQSTSGGQTVVPGLGLVLTLVVGSFVSCYYQAELNRMWDRRPPPSPPPPSVGGGMPPPPLPA